MGSAALGQCWPPAGRLHSAGNEWIAEWVAVDDDQYDYFWGNRMDVERTEWLQKGTGDGFSSGTTTATV